MFHHDAQLRKRPDVKVFYTNNHNKKNLINSKMYVRDDKVQNEKFNKKVAMREHLNMCNNEKMSRNLFLSFNCPHFLPLLLRRRHLPRNFLRLLRHLRSRRLLLQ